MSNKYFVMSLFLLTSFSYASASSSPSESLDNHDTMVVTASRFEQPITAVLAPVSVLTRSDLEALQATSLLDAIKVLPGIEIGQSGGRGQSASIFLRGTESNHVLVLLDGVRLPRTMMGTVDFNMLPLNTVERIEVIRGAGSTVYGSDAIGGVINIITRNDVESKRFGLGVGSFGTGLANAGITTQLTESLSMQLQGGFESTSGYNIHPEYTLPESEYGFESKNAAVRFSFDPVENWNSNLIGRWYQNKIEYDDFGNKKNGWVESYSVGLDTAYRAGPWNSLARLEIGEQENYDYLDIEPRDEADLTSKIRQIYSSFTSRYQMQDDLALTLGLDLTLEKYLKGNFISARDIADNPRKNIGLFALTNWNLTQSVLLEASFRHDKNDQFGGNNTGLIALGWNITPEYRLFASYGSAFKAPTFDSLYGYGGNVNLKSEHSKNIEFGLEGSLFDAAWTINAYINEIDNLINYDYTLPLAVNIDKAQIKGIEFSADFDISSLNNQITLDFRDPIDKTKNEQLARRAKQIFKWRTSIWIGDILLGTQYIYQSKRLDFSGGEMLGSYSVLDFTAQYDLTNQVTLSGKLANVLDEKYETAGGYPEAGRAFYLNLDFSY